MRKNVAATIAGNLSFVLGQFAILAALARLVGTTELGQYSLALAVAAPVFLFAGMTLRHVYVIDHEGRNAPRDYVAVRTASSMTAAAASAGVGLVAGCEVNVLVAVIGGRILDSQIDIYYSPFQRAERLSTIAWLQGSRGVLSAAIFVAVLAVWRDVGIAAWSLDVVFAAFMLWIGPHARRNSEDRRRASLPRCLRLARESSPLAVSVALGSLVVNVPRYEIAHFLTRADVGTYSALAYVLVGMTTLAGATVDSAAPRLARLRAEGDRRRFLHLVKILTVFGVGLGVVGAAATLAVGRTFLQVAFGEGVAKGWLALAILALASGLQCSTLYLAGALTTLRHFRSQVPAYAANLVVVTLVGWFAIAHEGLVAAAVAVLAGQLATSAVLLARYLVLVVPARWWTDQESSSAPRSTALHAR